LVGETAPMTTKTPGKIEAARQFDKFTMKGENRRLGGA
jgi:hypothetical protein